MFSKITQIFSLKVVSFLVLVLFISSSTNDLLSKDTLILLALAYIALKVSFYTAIFSVKANDLIVYFKPIAYLYAIQTMYFINGINLRETVNTQSRI